MKAEHPALPVTEVLAIERSEYKSVVFGLLCSGASPARTSTLIQQRYGESLDVDEVAAFAEQIPEEYFLEPGELQKRVSFVDIEMDTIGELAAILRYYKAEVDIALLATELSDGDGTVTEDTRKLMNQYWSKLLKFEELRGDLGLVPVASQQIAPPAETQLITLRDLMLQQNIILPIVAVTTKEEFIEAEYAAEEERS